MTAIATATPDEPPAPIKIDLGCGSQKKEGFAGLDRIAFDGVDHVLDIGREPWPFGDATVSEAHSSHFLEHLTAVERIHFFNELYRVLVPGGKCTIIVPHWASTRAYGDPTHCWPPVSEMSFYYLKKEWRMANAPHTDVEHWDKGYACNLDATWGYSLHPLIEARNQEYQQFAINFYKESAQDLFATVTKA